MSSIALMNFVPRTCPKCSVGLSLAFKDAGSRQDFFAGAASTCPGCGLSFAYTHGPAILAAAQGDMQRHVKPEDVNE